MVFLCVCACAPVRVRVCVCQHIGPAIPEVSSIWFKLYLYHVTSQGPPSLLLSKGSRLRKLPDIFQVSRRIPG